MQSDRSVYPLADPQEVDVSAIEQELENLWRNAHAEGEPAVLHAAAFNLIYVMREFDDGGESYSLVARLANEHPSRAVLVRLNNKNGSAPRAWVTAYCHRPEPSSPQICSEFIVLEADSGSQQEILSLLLALRLPGLPGVLVWDNSLSSKHPLLLELGRQLDRVIVSVIPPCSEIEMMKPFFAVREFLGSKPLVTDLTESLLISWQIQIARLFDSDPQSASRIREIRMKCENQKPSAEFLLLAAWISSVVEWKPANVEAADDQILLRFADDRSIVLESNTDRCNRIEFQMESLKGRQLLTCEEPESEIRVAELLLMQLQIWNRNPLREEMLRRARMWIDCLRDE